MSVSLKSASLVLLVLFASMPVGADDAELERLVRIHREIGVLVSMIEQMEDETVKDDGTGVRFRYDRLKLRLRNLQTDIHRHIDYVRDGPKLRRFDVE